MNTKERRNKPNIKVKKKERKKERKKENEYKDKEK